MILLRMFLFQFSLQNILMVKSIKDFKEEGNAYFLSLYVKRMIKGEQIHMDVVQDEEMSLVSITTMQSISTNSSITFGVYQPSELGGKFA